MHIEKEEDEVMMGRRSHSKNEALSFLSRDFLNSTRDGGEYFEKTELSTHHKKRRRPFWSQAKRDLGKLVLIGVAWLIFIHYVVRPVSKELLLGLGATLLAAALGVRPFIFLFHAVYKRVKFAIYMRRKPRRILLIRHGESLGNVDTTAYARTPDHAIPLTEKGAEQATCAGMKMREMIGLNETIRFFVSPYRRTRETFQYILEGWGLSDNQYTVREEPRIREQDWSAGLQDPAEVRRSMKERRAFGAFFYRFPDGEAGSDVFTRVDTFWSALFREMKYPNCLENFVIVSHGITIRMIIMRYLKFSVEEFHLLWNLENCQIIELRLQPNGKYALATPLRRNIAKDRD